MHQHHRPRAALLHQLQNAFRIRVRAEAEVHYIAAHVQLAATFANVQVLQQQQAASLVLTCT